MNNKKLRVCHYPQIPCKPFIVEVNDLNEAKLIFKTLADYDLFQFKNRIKPDYCNSTILEEWDKEEQKWLSWCDEETGIDDLRQYFEFIESKLDNCILSKKEIIERVRNCAGLIDIKEDEKHIYAYDEQEKKHCYFRFLENINFEEIFKFGVQEVDKERFFNILKTLDLRLFLMPEKIYFINNEEEYSKLVEEYPSQFMDLENAVGINWYEDNIIVINVLLIRKLTKELIEENPHFSYEKELNIGIWQTLIHELRHMLCDSAVIIYDNEVPIEEADEKKVEEYCREIFEDKVRKMDYICFK